MKICSLFPIFLSLALSSSSQSEEDDDFIRSISTGHFDRFINLLKNPGQVDPYQVERFIGYASFALNGFSYFTKEDRQDYFDKMQELGDLLSNFNIPLKSDNILTLLGLVSESAHIYKLKHLKRKIADNVVDPREHDPRYVVTRLSDQWFFCRHLAVEILFDLHSSILLDNREDQISLSNIDARCIQLMKGFSGERAKDISEIVPFLPENVFEYVYSSLHPNTLSTTTPQQIQYFASIDSQRNMCSEFDYSRLRPALLPQISLSCLRRIVVDEPSVLLKIKASTFNQNIMEVCKDIPIMDAHESGLINKWAIRWKKPWITCVKRMKGIFTSDEAQAANISSFIHLLPPSLFEKLQGDLHTSVIEQLPPFIAERFGIKTPEMCMKIDLTRSLQNNLLQFPANCLSSFLDRFPSLDKQKWLKAIKKSSKIDYIANMKHLWQPNTLRNFSVKFLASSIITPTDELIGLVGPQRAFYWGKNHPEICSFIPDSIDRECLALLDPVCQLFAAKTYSSGLIEEASHQALITFKAKNGFSYISLKDLFLIPQKYRSLISAQSFAKALKKVCSLTEEEVDFTHFNRNLLKAITGPINNKIVSLKFRVDMVGENPEMCMFYYPDELSEEVRYQVPFCDDYTRKLAEIFPERSIWIEKVWKNVLNFTNGVEKAENILEEILQEVYRNTNPLYHHHLSKLLRLAIFKNLPETIDPDELALVLQKSINATILPMLLLSKNDAFLQAISKPLSSQVKYLNMMGKDLAGTYFPKYLFDHIVQNAKNLAGQKCVVTNGVETDGQGMLNNLIDQCSEFILNGPSQEMLKVELGKLYHDNFNLGPLLTKVNESSDYLFFPFRSDRTIVKFVAFTIGKALQQNITPSLNIDPSIFRMMLLAKPSERNYSANEKRLLEEYHDSIYTGQFGYGIDVISDYLRSTLTTDEDFNNLYLTKTDYFYKPFSFKIHYEESYLIDGTELLKFQTPITSRPQLEAYLVKFREMAYEEFRGLLWSFRQILSQTLRVELFQYQWTDELISSLIDGPGYTPEMILSSLKHKKSLASHKIRSLVRLSNGKIPKIDLLTALSMLLQCLNAKQLRRLVASFTGSASRMVKAKSLSFGHKLSSRKFAIGELAVYGDIISMEEGEQIIARIYQMQLEYFDIADSEGTSLATNDSFKGAKGHTCFDTLEVNFGQSNYSLLHALFQQINAPNNYIHGKNK